MSYSPVLPLFIPSPGRGLSGNTAGATLGRALTVCYRTEATSPLWEPGKGTLHGGRVPLVEGLFYKLICLLKSSENKEVAAGVRPRT